MLCYSPNNWTSKFTFKGVRNLQVIHSNAIIISVLQTTDWRSLHIMWYGTLQGKQCRPNRVWSTAAEEDAEEAPLPIVIEAAATAMTGRMDGCI